MNAYPKTHHICEVRSSTAPSTTATRPQPITRSWDPEPTNPWFTDRVGCAGPRHGGWALDDRLVS